jgi:hypothetical protein
MIRKKNNHGKAQKYDNIPMPTPQSYQIAMQQRQKRLNDASRGSMFHNSTSDRLSIQVVV